MTTEQLAQEVQELRTQNLTPVSPKPIHFPQPSNIPLLDLAMDPAFDTSTALSAPPPSNEPVTTEGGQPEALEITADTRMMDANDAGLVSGAAVPSNDILADQTVPLEAGDQPQVDKQALSTAIESALGASNQYAAAAPPLNDAALAFLQSLVMSSAASTATTPSTTVPYAQPSEASQAANVPALEQQSQIVSSNDAVMENADADPVIPDAPADDASTPAAVNEPETITTTAQESTQKDAMPQDTGPPGIHQTPIRLIPTVPSLPARPPVHQAGSDIRSKQSYDQNSTTQNGLGQDQLSLATDKGDGAGTISNAANQSIMSPTPIGQQQEGATADASNGPDPEDEPFSPELQKLYDDFLTDERNNMTLNDWDRFPAGSRLFIGNLPSEKVTKPDIFRVFHKYGKLAQISIKQAYGFAQYYEAESCARALQTEQAVAIRGRKIHLEISKPQRNKNQQNDNRRSSNLQRRSRSPDYGRGSADRYRSDNRMGRGRDGYRPRSPSPRRGYGRRSPDRYDGRRRSRSRTPPGQRGRYPGMDQRQTFDDDCPLPRRRPEQIPDIQIISQQPPERSFIQYVERAFESRGVKCDVLLLSPRLPEASVLRRQIIEGVHAVMKLEKQIQYTNKFPLSIFDRSTPGNVRFEEYQDLDLPICVELVLRAKQNAVRVATPQQQQQYPAPSPYPPYGAAVAPPPPPSAGMVPPPIPPQYLQNQLQRGAAPPPPMPPLPSQLDAASIQRLLGQLPPPTPSQSQSFPQQQQQGYPPPTPGQPPLPSSADLARLLASAGAGGGQPPAFPPATPTSAASFAPPPPQAQGQNGANAYQALLSNPALAALLKGSAPASVTTPQPGQGQGQIRGYHQNGGQQAGQQQQQPDMQNIMAKLARYG